MSLADLLKPSIPIAGHEQLARRTHTMRDQVTRDATPTQQREAILEALREKQPRDRDYFREALGIGGADLEIALTRLRDKNLIYGIQGEGYRLGRRPLPAVPGTPVIQPSKETNMPKGQYDRSKAKARKTKTDKPADDDSASPTPATTTGKNRKLKRRAATKRAAPVAARPRSASGECSFAVNDAGCVTVTGVDGARIELSLPDTKRLEAFMGRTKSIRGRG